MSARHASIIRCTLYLLTSLLSLPAQAGIVYVSAGAPGPAHDGVAWPTACQTIQQGIDAAQAGDEVWVAAGTYPELVTTKSGVALYGGFSGSETERDQRSPSLHETIIDGERARMLVIFPAGVGPDTVIDGFSLIRATAWAFAYRAPVNCEGVSPTIRNNVFRENGGPTSGITVTGAGAAPLIEGNTFSADHAAKQCILVMEGASAIIRNNTIHDIQGTGIHVMSPNCLIENNTLDVNAGPSWDSGSQTPGIWLQDADSIVRGNAISRFIGGGIAVDRGAPSILQNRLERNNAQSGACISLNQASGKVAGNTIVDNVGTCIYLSQANCEVAGNTIVRNVGKGIGIYMGAPLIHDNLIIGNAGASTDPANPSIGVAVNSFSSEKTPLPRIINNTIVGNTNGSVINWGGLAPEIRNNIIAWNDSLGSLTRTTNINAHTNLLWNNPDAASNGSAEPDAAGNFSADPLFTDRAAGDYHLAAGSPGLDTGDTSAVSWSTDFDGNPRVSGRAVDQGAFEAIQAPTHTLADAASALRLAAGLAAPEGDEASRLDVFPSPGIDMADAISLCKEAISQSNR